MEPVNEAFLCSLLRVNSAGGVREMRHIAFRPPPRPLQLWLRGWEKARLPRAREDSGMCVLSLSCRFPGSWFA